MEQPIKLCMRFVGCFLWTQCLTYQFAHILINFARFFLSPFSSLIFGKNKIPELIQHHCSDWQNETVKKTKKKNWFWHACHRYSHCFDFFSAAQSQCTNRWLKSFDHAKTITFANWIFFVGFDFLMAYKAAVDAALCAVMRKTEIY